MERVNTFIVEVCPALRELADNCAKLWNEINFERRQAYIHFKKFSWYPKHLYAKYAPLIGSATAQQIIKKNNEAWRSFLTLKRLKAEGRLPKHITRISMPRYWKKNGRRELKIIVRSDCYRIDDEYLHLPKGLKLKCKSKLRWKGKLGRLEIIYDKVDGVWRGFITVKVEKPPLKGGCHGKNNSCFYLKVEKSREASTYLLCHSKGARRYRGLFYCGKCSMTMNADAVGVLNIARNYGAIIPSPSWGRDNGVVAHPMLLRWNRMRWEPKRAMNNQPITTLEARISRL
jgi:transposase